ncbi:MAG: hypothetical protein NT025_01125 [bacterium]|nr:hypothetical protein [bacterium]
MSGDTPETGVDDKGKAKMAPQTRPQLDENKFYLDYGSYAKFRGKILMAGH